MTTLIASYRDVVGTEEIAVLEQLASRLQGRRVVHVNSTKEGGGVAEILQRLVPLQRELGIDAHWDIVDGPPEFYQATKTIHNTLQGAKGNLAGKYRDVFENTGRRNGEKLRDILEDADFVFIHDPQPAPLIAHCPGRQGRWIWRCHIDLSSPNRAIWRYLHPWVKAYDASVFSLPDFAQPLPHPVFLVPPCIDPLSEKNAPLPEEEVLSVFDRIGLDRKLPLVVQVSRFDHFKDPLGVIEACRLVMKDAPLQLVLAGGGASDDPEGEAVLQEVRFAAEGLPHVHILILPSDAHRTINALQRAATVVVQKSLKEGFGLTVTEAMWKGKPVIGGNVGGIRLQIVQGQTGYRVNTVEGLAFRLRHLLQRPEECRAMGKKGREYAMENFLLPRLVRNELAIMLLLLQGDPHRLEVTV